MHKITGPCRLSCSWVSLFLLLYVFLPSFVLSIFLLLRTGSPALAYWCGLAILTGLAFYNREKISLVDALLFLLLVIFAHLVSYVFFDLFHDGLAYHQPAISRITKGFNPVYDGYMKLGRPADTWSDQATYFPKITWYFAASVTAVMGDIQPGKAYHLILLFSAVLFVIHYTAGEHPLKRLLWVGASLNPIVFLQYTGYNLDGALGSLVLMTLFYANFYYSGKPLTRIPYFIGTLSLAMLMSIKTSGFAYGSIIAFCICLHCLFMQFRILKGPTYLRLMVALKKAVFLGLKLGLPLLVLVLIVGFSPYATNLLQGRHVFYPLMGGDAARKADVASVLDNLATDAFPDAHNRFTRLLFSIAAYPTHPEAGGQNYPVELKNPLGVARLEWLQYRIIGSSAAGGLGPLFCLLLLLGILYQVLLKGRGNGWLLLTLFLMIFMQPYGWYFRYSPFVWFLPFVFCLTVPSGREYLLAVPIIIAFINTVGVAYVFTDYCWNESLEIIKELSPYRGQHVLLNKSIFQCDGFFDRFNIKQKFANPEETVFYTLPWATSRPQPDTGHLAFGSNIAFVEDIPPLPKGTLVFEENFSEPWRKMSEGCTLYEPQKQKISWAPSGFSVSRGFWNYAGKIKFFMQVIKEPDEDMNFIFTATPRIGADGSPVKQIAKVFVNYRQLGEWLFDQPGSVEKSIVIPKATLEESYNDEMHLLTLMFRLSNPDAPTGAQRFSLMFEKMEFRPVEQ